ncbi:hypothetical protein niasHT_010243 [Heterodera trifolii]|uniref:Uncharacterized protein n=1 Tax=Heterodera trifolii TaxID=157864 RepID=A0ABD2LSR8_9BILA
MYEEVILVHSDEAIAMAKRLAREEGLLSGCASRCAKAGDGRQINCHRFAQLGRALSVQQQQAVILELDQRFQHFKQEKVMEEAIQDTEQRTAVLWCKTCPNRLGTNHRNESLPTGLNYPIYSTSLASNARFLRGGEMPCPTTELGNANSLVVVPTRRQTLTNSLVVVPTRRQTLTNSLVVVPTRRQTLTNSLVVVPTRRQTLTNSLPTFNSLSLPA